MHDSDQNVSLHKESIQVSVWLISCNGMNKYMTYYYIIILSIMSLHVSVRIQDNLTSTNWISIFNTVIGMRILVVDIIGHYNIYLIIKYDSVSL